MIYGNYIINAEQAWDITKQAIKWREGFDENFAFKQAETELKEVCGAIFEAANRGKASTTIWIRYNSTYDALLEHGFKLSGGVIRENMPKSKWNTFGTASDAVLVEWGDSSSE